MDQEREIKDRKALDSVFSPKKSGAIQYLDYATVRFGNPIPDVFTAKQIISNAAWVKTTEGVVVIDTLLNAEVGGKMYSKIKESGDRVKYVILTHGHGDHTGGMAPFMADAPEIIAHYLINERFEKYQILAEYRATIGSIQFNTPGSIPLEKVVTPTRTFDYSMEFKLGDKTFELYNARAETDDAVWVFVPEIKTVFLGDLLIGGFPNIGNPFKPTRFALPWARALETIRDKNPEMIVTGGGFSVYQGDHAREVLDVTIEAIHSIHDQVVDGINQDMPVDELIHSVKLPEHLKDHKYLRFIYSRPEFAVYNIYRWYHGYFDHNPAHLLPRPDKEINAEIIALIGDPQKIVDRAKQLFEKDQAQLALQVLDILLKSEPKNVEARKLHLKILEVLCEADYCLMSRNTWVYFMDKDKEFLGIKD